MPRNYDEDLRKLSEALATMTELELENKAGLAAVQIAFLSLSSQLADQGLVHPELIAENLKKAVDGMRDDLGKSASFIDQFATQIEVLVKFDPVPPSTGRLRLVKPDE